MIKKNFKIIFLISLLVLSGLMIMIFNQKPSNNLSDLSEELKINGRTVINAQKKLSHQEIKKLKPRNTPSPEWKKNVEKNLRIQGGDSLKEIQIEVMESMVWIQNNNALNVESLKISLKNKQNREVSFRALVDSSNGKILQTWDQPVICPINPRGEPGIQIDPRYFSN